MAAWPCESKHSGFDSVFPAWFTGSAPEALEIAAAVSRRKHLFSSAASSGVNGGTNRVFSRPACGALVIIAQAQRRRGTWSLAVGSRKRNGFIGFATLLYQA